MNAKEKEEVARKLATAVEKLVALVPESFIPDEGMNIVYAIPDARIPSDVAGIDGKIFKTGKDVSHTGQIKFGADNRIDRIVLTAMNFDPDIRCAAIIRFSEEIIKKSDELLLEVRSFDREKEPLGINTIDWGVAFCCKEEDVPDIIYDRGAAGKEAMIRILGEDPSTVVNNIIMLSERIIKETNG